MLRHAFESDPTIADAAAADMRRFVEVDPATEGTLGVMLFFKGFQAVQCARAAHYFWQEEKGEGRQIAKLLQSEMADVFGVDIHPGAVFGRGVTIDHATGVVIGETAVVGDDVYIMHDVRGRAAFWRSRRVASRRRRVRADLRAAAAPTAAVGPRRSGRHVGAAAVSRGRGRRRRRGAASRRIRLERR